MKSGITLSMEQQRAVLQHLPVVNRVIRKYITVNPAICGLAYDDLFQEGCVWLCKAAVTYCPEKGAGFETYAERVVANGLLAYCRRSWNKAKRLCSISDCPDAVNEIPAPQKSIDEILMERDILHMLSETKRQYSGVARAGIEAIAWKVQGLSGSEIATLYGVKPNTIGAWISRAVQKLRKNIVFTSWIEKMRENEKEV